MVSSLAQALGTSYDAVADKLENLGDGTYSTNISDLKGLLNHYRN